MKFFAFLRMLFVMILYLPVTFLSVLQSIKSIQSAIDYNRGTNAASRFVRDVRSHFNSKGAVLWGTIQAFMGLLCSFILEFKLITLLMPVPGVIIIIASFVMQNKMSKNKQRIKDARVVTKTGTKVVGSAAVGIGAVAGVAAAPFTGGASLAATAAVVGTTAAATTGVCKAVGKMGDTMTDVEAPDINESDFAQFNSMGKQILSTYGISVDEQDQFVLDANKLGIKGNNVEEIGQSALKSPVMQTLLNEKNLEPTVENVIPFVQRALKAAK